MSEKSIAVDIDLGRKKKVWLDIINAELSPPTKREGEITVEEFANLAGISISYARKKLDKLVKEGKVTKRYFADGKYRRVMVYLPIEETS